MTASGFIGSRDERGALGGGAGIEWTASLAIGAIGGSGGGAERGSLGGTGEDLGATEAGGGEMLGEETRGATGAGEA